LTIQDKYLRALAELENVRARLTKQIADSKLYAVQGFCKDLLEVKLESLLWFIIFFPYLFKSHYVCGIFLFVYIFLVLNQIFSSIDIGYIADGHWQCS